ncbi:MAG: hypothetical protein FJ150_11010 [Euryarchaeota archaeon]|nr:hypothetical protein [Euryarchaeota archaeon]
MNKYVIPIAIVIVVFLALGLVFGPSMMNQITGNGTKTYDNSSLGVSFDYPGNWEISTIERDFHDNDTKYVYLGDPNDRINLTDEEKRSVCRQLYATGVSVNKEQSSADWSYEDEMAVAAEVRASYSEDGYQVSQKNITIDGIPAHEQRYSDNESVQIDVDFEKNGYLYSINFIGRINDKNWESHYNMIINSFKIK